MRLDALFVNGRFRTLDPGRPRARALGVFAGRVAGVDEEVEDLPADLVVDLAGAPAVPGFNDAHHHLSLRGARLRALDLRAAAVPTLEGLYAAVAAHAARLPEGAWVRGSGYDQNKIGGHPTARALDRVCGGRPVWLEHVSGHMGVGSTEAFARAGYPGGEGVPDTVGGHVVRDADGRARGLLQETAQALVKRVLRPVPVDEIVECLAAGSAAALADGITSATEPGIGSVDHVGNGPVDLHAFLRAREEGRLGVRMTVMPYLTVLRDLGVFQGEERWFGLDLGLRTGAGDDRLRVGPAKVLSDGSLIGRSAHVCRDYHDEPGNRGLLQFDAEELVRMVGEAHRCGWRVAAHAIGDAAVDVVLDGFERAQREVPRPGVRHRIEHFAVTGPEQVRRAAGLGVVAVPQGRFVGEIGDGMLAALGPERARGCYRMRSLLEAGMVLPGSSDAPVADASPLRGMHDMVNRLTDGGVPLAPQEALTPEQALRAYTLGSAYAGCEEDRKGALRRGMLADFVVLSDDVLSVDPGRIGGVEAGATVVGGRVAHDAGAVRVV